MKKLLLTHITLLILCFFLVAFQLFAVHSSLSTLFSYILPGHRTQIERNKTLRRHLGHLLNVVCTLNLRPGGYQCLVQSQDLYHKLHWFPPRTSLACLSKFCEDLFSWIKSFYDLPCKTGIFKTFVFSRQDLFIFVNLGKIHDISTKWNAQGVNLPLLVISCKLITTLSHLITIH